MTSFTLLKGKTLYKQILTSLPPYWDNGLLIKPEPTITYETILNCNVEPLDPEETELLPAGIKTKDTKWLYTPAKLKTYKENNDDIQKADKVYLVNPETASTKPVTYIVWDSEEWDTASDFQLIADEHSYILIKEGVIR